MIVMMMMMMMMMMTTKMMMMVLICTQSPLCTFLVMGGIWKKLAVTAAETVRLLPANGAAFI